MFRHIFILALAFFLYACKQAEYGSVNVNLKDGPAQYQEINIDIEKVEVLITGIKEKGWYELKTQKGIYDILSFKDVSLLLASHYHLPVGRISQVRMTLGNNNTIKNDDVHYPLLLDHGPGEKFTFLLPAENMIIENNMLNLLIDIDSERSVLRTGVEKFRFEPVAACGEPGSNMN